VVEFLRDAFLFQNIFLIFTQFNKKIII